LPRIYHSFHLVSPAAAVMQVVWGHEHECKPAPEHTAEMDRSFSVLQPGSTVATSLSEPESQPKQCFLLDIAGVSWRVQALPLTTVRPFNFKSVRSSSSRPVTNSVSTVCPERLEALPCVAFYLKQSRRGERCEHRGVHIGRQAAHSWRSHVKRSMSGPAGPESAP
jgi:hypothetical protein